MNRIEWHVVERFMNQGIKCEDWLTGVCVPEGQKEPSERGIWNMYKSRTYCKLRGIKWRPCYQSSHIMRWYLGKGCKWGIYLAFGVLLEDMFTYTLVVRLRRQNWMIRHEDRISYSWTNRQYYGWLIYGPKENPVDMRWRPFYYLDYRGMLLINVILVVKGSRSLLYRKRSFQH